MLDGGLMKKLLLISAALMCLLFLSASAFGQTPVPMASTGTYTEDFSTVSTWTNGFTSPTQATRFGGVAVNATGTIPDGKRVTTATTTFTSGTSGGVQKGTGTLVLLSTGTTDNTSSAAVDLFLDFTGVNAGTLSFDWASVNNSTGDRKGSMRVYTSTDGTTFTELTGAAALNFTNNSPTSGSIVNVQLPSAFDNNPNARIRFYYYNGTGGTTGSRPKLALDNLKVTSASSGPAAEPTTPASNVTFTNVSSTSLTVNWTNGNGSGRIVVAKQGAPVDAVPVDGTSYTANTAFGSGSTTGGDNFVVFAGSGSGVTVTNLQPSTNYYFAVFEYNGFSTSVNYLTTNPATGSQTAAAAYQISGTVRSRSGAGLSGVTIALSSGDTPVANTLTDSNGNYSFASVTAGADYSVTPSSASFKFSPVSASVNALGSNQTIDFTGTPRVIISEFRFRGTDPDGAGPLTASANEFVELYNQTDESVTLTGWTLRASDGTTLLTLPAAVVAARSHYLVAGSGYGLSSYAAANATLGADIPDGAGVALFNSGTVFDASTRLDAVGFSGVGDSAYREGTGLTPAGGVTSDAEFSFVRYTTNGLPNDADNNEADFLFVSTDGGVYGSRQSGLGAPGPENSSSPLVLNSTVGVAMLDPSASSSSYPNRERDFNADPDNNAPAGRMYIRRTVTNNTGANVTRLRFRVINMTTYPAPAGYADMRAISSGSVSVTVTGGASKTVLGTTLETPPAQPKGGGNNSTLAAGTVTLDSPLADHQSIDLQFVLGVQNGGVFRFYVNVEAVTQAPTSASEHLVMGNPSNAVVDVNQPTNYLLDKPQYAVGYHRDRGIPNWVSWHLDTTWLGSAPRQNDFRPDPSLPADWYHVQSTDYQNSGFDRGHHTPSADRTNTVASNSATFLMTNMMPQAPDNNQGPWEQLESYSRTLVSAGNELYIVAGGSGTGGSGSNGGTTNTVAGGHVTVPNVTWKVIMVLPAASGNDVSRVNNSTRVIAIIMPNTQGIRTNTWQQYRVSVDQVEALTGFDFFSNVPVAVQNVIEATVDNQ
jgi:endonuclease G